MDITLLKFKRVMAGEYIDATNTYKIEQNCESKEWHLFIMDEETNDWEWDRDLMNKKDGIIEANVHKIKKEGE